MEYLLQVRRQLTVTQIGHSVCRENWGLMNRCMEENELIVVYRGTLRCEVGGEQFSLAEGDACLLPAGVLHSQFCRRETCRFFYAHFPGELVPIPAEERRRVLEEKIRRPYIDRGDIYKLPSMAEEETFLVLNTRMPHSPGTEEVFTLFQKALIERNHNNVGRLLSISSYITHILVLLCRQYMGKDHMAPQNLSGQKKLVQDALFHFRSHYTEPIRVPEVSESLGISQQYLAKLFRSELGMSPVKYLNKLRVERAKALMRGSEANISEIAYQVGFDSLYYFSRVFKQYEGISPSIYRLWLNSKSNE